MYIRQVYVSNSGEHVSHMVMHFFKINLTNLTQIYVYVCAVYIPSKVHY